MSEKPALHTADIAGWTEEEIIITCTIIIVIIVVKRISP